MLQGDMMLTLPDARRDPIFGMVANDSLSFANITPIPNIGSHGTLIDSFRLEANDMAFTIHTLFMNQLLAYYRIGLKRGCETCVISYTLIVTAIIMLSYVQQNP